MLAVGYNHQGNRPRELDSQKERKYAIQMNNVNDNKEDNAVRHETFMRRSKEYKDGMMLWSPIDFSALFCILPRKVRVISFALR